MELPGRRREVMLVTPVAWPHERFSEQNQAAGFQLSASL